VNAAEHAANILCAWMIADQDRFETELETVLSCSETQRDRRGLESEQHELLESIAEHFQSLPSDKRFSCSRAGATVALLRHLTDRTPGRKNPSP
jgi:hypothetical protein